MSVDVEIPFDRIVRYCRACKLITLCVLCKKCGGETEPAWKEDRNGNG